MFNLFKAINESLVNKKTKPTAEMAAGYIEVVREAGSVFGTFLREPSEIIEEIKEFQLKRNNIKRSDILDLIEKRNNFRKDKNFAESDAIRDTLLSMNILIQDTPNGTEWVFK